MGKKGKCTMDGEGGGIRGHGLNSDRQLDFTNVVHFTHHLFAVPFPIDME